MFDLLRGKIAGQLVDNRTDDLKVGKLFCSNIGQYSGNFFIWHGIPLG